MRFHLVGMLLLASVAAPAAAQRTESPERRIDRLEQELRAVQRRVFPGGAQVAPEIEPEPGAAGQAGVPASSAIADLTARVDSLEAQLRELTGQTEQNSNRLRQMEAALAQLRDSVGARLDALERSAAPSEPVRDAAPALPRPSTAVTEADRPAPAASRDADAEEAYNAGFRLWEAKRYTEAQKALEGVAKRYPGSKWASWANNLAGRAYLDAGKPATAAKTFLANYQGNPRGERAADSLYFLGLALVALDKPADACKAYDELQDVYGAAMRDWLRQRLPAARSQAKCR
ncbi:MAG TPA: outer membrane protein assembly factor BamD [Allosphingosinicella sp.]